MENGQIFRGVELLKELSVQEFFMFFVYLSLIFVIKLAIEWILKLILKRTAYKKRFIPIVEAILNWLAFYSSIILFLFYFWKERWLTYPFYETDGVQVTVFLIVVVIMIVTFASRIIKTFNRHVMPFIYEQFDIDVGLSFTINRLIYYTVMFLALALSFTTVGLDLTALGVVFSVLGIGIGFGVRNIAANFVSGIIILFERPMEVGEMVEIDNKIGKIKRIKLRSTVVETLKDGTLVVPNQYFIEQIVKNRSSAELFARVEVSVKYGSDTARVEQLICDAAEKEIAEMAGVPEDQQPDVRFIGFRNSALDFQVEVHVTNVQMKEQLESRIRHAIAGLFFENGIELGIQPPANN
ncbi:mechanosensitive ion channel family protein [Planococcus sp. X10-3]|uniref:mechanosensitive ion channel family protein n=1 Tax=Planococcus sp. X10-3 TaxID=3061240 RepID=UPI003BAFCAC8